MRCYRGVLVGSNCRSLFVVVVVVVGGDVVSKAQYY